MSNKNHNNYGVPWYANSKTPAIRNKVRILPKWIEEKYADGKARQMQALKYIRNWIRENWKKGDRFVYEIEYNGIVKETLRLTGTFDYLKQTGCYWSVFVVLDEGQKAPNGPRLGMYLFYCHANKEDEHVEETAQASITD